MVIISDNSSHMNSSADNNYKVWQNRKKNIWSHYNVNQKRQILEGAWLERRKYYSVNFVLFKKFYPQDRLQSASCRADETQINNFSITGWKNQKTKFKAPTEVRKWKGKVQKRESQTRIPGDLVCKFFPYL